MSKIKIDSIEVEEVKDSRGVPTIGITMGSGEHTVTASVPSGKSSGTREALEMRDEDGKGVTNAIKGLEDIIIPALFEREFESSIEVDELLLELDGTKNKTKLGANATLAVSIAATKLFAKVQGVPTWKYISELGSFTPSYPRFYMNMMNGGSHADFCLPFQEYILVIGSEEMKPTEQYKKANEIFDALGEKIREELGEVGYGDEGGYTPTFDTIERPFELLDEFAEGDDDAYIAIDAAASEFYKDGEYEMLGKKYDREAMLEVYKNITDKFDFKSNEDAFEESDVEGFAAITASLGDRILVVGDDYTVTNKEILADRIEKKSGNALIIKPNQIGTIKEVIETVQLAYEAGWKCVASHRSGETTDDFIADLAVGIGAYGLKAGAPTQEERRVKYERLMEIEKELG